jgi:hypothetical protein
MWSEGGLICQRRPAQKHEQQKAQSQNATVNL